MRKNIGIWLHNLNDDDVRALPQELVGDWEPNEKTAVVKYLNSSKPSMDDLFHGHQLQWFHICLFGCGTRLGSARSFDSSWTWRSDLSHYVEHHDVTLPQEFIRHVMQSREQAVLSDRSGRSDHSFWIDWCQENRSHAFETRIRELREEAEALYLKERTIRIKAMEASVGLSHATCMYRCCDQSALKDRAFCAGCEEKYSGTGHRASAYSRKFQEISKKPRKRFLELV